MGAGGDGRAGAGAGAGGGSEGALEARGEPPLPAWGAESCAPPPRAQSGGAAGAGAEDWGWGNEAVLRSLVRAEAQRWGRGRAAAAAGAGLLADRRLLAERDAGLHVAAVYTEVFGLSAPTFHLAASLYDSLFLRLAAGEPTGSGGAHDLDSARGSAQAAAVCVCIAAKVEEVVPPTCGSYVALYERILAPVVLEAELGVCSAFGAPPTPVEPGVLVASGGGGNAMAALADPSRHEEREVGPQNGGQQKEWLQGHFCALEASVLDALGWVTTPPTALHFYDRLRALRDSGQARRRGDGAPPPPAEAGPRALDLLFQAAVRPEVALLFRPSTVALAVLACLRGPQTPCAGGSAALDLEEACREVERYRAEAHVDPLWLFGQMEGPAATAAAASAACAAASATPEKGKWGTGDAAAPALLGCARARGPCLGGLV